MDRYDQDQLALFAENCRTMKQSFKLKTSQMNRLAALLYALEHRKLHADELQSTY